MTLGLQPLGHAAVYFSVGNTPNLAPVVLNFKITVYGALSLFYPKRSARDVL